MRPDWIVDKVECAKPTGSWHDVFLRGENLNYREEDQSRRFWWQVNAKHFVGNKRYVMRDGSSKARAVFDARETKRR